MDIHSESASGNRGGPQESRSNSLPEPTESLSGYGLPDAVSHGLVLLLIAKSVTLHLTLNHVEGVAADPEDFTGDTTISGYFDVGDFFALDIIALHIQGHHVLE